MYVCGCASVKRQLLQFQSPISGLFPVLSTDIEVGSVRDSVYCAAAVWSLYQAYRYVHVEIHSTTTSYAYHYVRMSTADRLKKTTFVC